MSPQSATPLATVRHQAESSPPCVHGPVTVTSLQHTLPEKLLGSRLLTRRQGKLLSRCVIHSLYDPACVKSRLGVSLRLSSYRAIIPSYAPSRCLTRPLRVLPPMPHSTAPA